MIAPWTPRKRRPFTSKGPIKVFIPLKGFSSPDREGLPHWNPDGNQDFIHALKHVLNPSVSLFEIDAHINDPAFIDPVVEASLSMI